MYWLTSKYWLIPKCVDWGSLIAIFMLGRFSQVQRIATIVGFYGGSERPGSLTLQMHSIQFQNKKYQPEYVWCRWRYFLKIYETSSLRRMGPITSYVGWFSPVWMKYFRPPTPFHPWTYPLPAWKPASHQSHGHYVSSCNLLNCRLWKVRLNIGFPF